MFASVIGRGGVWTPPRHVLSHGLPSLAWNLTYTGSAGDSVQNWTILKTIIEPLAEILWSTANSRKTGFPALMESRS
jgi:hypothetical protein